MRPALGLRHTKSTVSLMQRTRITAMQSKPSSPLFEGTCKTLIHTSGSSIVADKALGEYAGRIYEEDGRPDPEPERAARVAVDTRVLDAASEDIRTVVVCPAMIYGTGPGLKRTSEQVPLLIAQAEETGVARHIGRGLNLWSNVHIADLADLYLLALEHANAGLFFFAENGEATLRDVVEAIRQTLSLARPTESLPIEDAIARWGYMTAVFGLSSNSRVRAVNARRLLGWRPKRPGLFEEILL